MNFVYLFKEPAPEFINPLDCSSSLLFPSFYLLWAIFVAVPGVLVGVGLGCLFEMFLSF